MGLAINLAAVTGRRRLEGLMREVWGSLSVNDHLHTRALIAEILLFDRVVVPVPPADDREELRRWRLKRWNPHRQKYLLSILGDGPTQNDLAVTVPWTETKRRDFKVLVGESEDPVEKRNLQRQYLDGLQYDSKQLKHADAGMLTRIILTHDSADESYARRLPTVDVEAVVPAYHTFNEARAISRLTGADERATRQRRGTCHPGAGLSEHISPNASLIRWHLFVPADASWTDAVALRKAAELARCDEYREQRDEFRGWWRSEIARGAPPDFVVEDIARRAEKLNTIAKSVVKRTRTLQAFALVGGAVGIAGAWFPPVAAAGGSLTLVSVAADALWPEPEISPTLAPAAMFTDARRVLARR